jgi:uncharacterized protein (DUF486 family)
MPTIALLIASSCFMTVPWYWHLKGGVKKPLLLVIMISWGIALFEYRFTVPAKRLGYAYGWSGGQHKIAQEVITLLVFGVLMVAVLGEPLTWRHLGAFASLIGAVAFVLSGK